MEKSSKSSQSKRHNKEIVAIFTKKNENNRDDCLMIKINNSAATVWMKHKCQRLVPAPF